jgi:hypothetical protein
MVEGKMRQFKKAPAYAGKPLSLYVHRGNRSIGDHEVLTGDEWAKFVQMGYLVELEPVQAQVPVEPQAVPRVVEELPVALPPVEAPAASDEPVEPEKPVEDAEEPRDEGAVTKSPFGKSKKQRR